MTERYDSKDIADRAGIGNSTVRKWVQEYGLPHTRKRGGKIVFDEDILDTIAAIKQLKGDGAGYDTITQTIGTARAQPGQRQSKHGNARAEPEQRSAALDDKLKVFSADLANSIKEGIQSELSQNNHMLASHIDKITELAEKAAHAAHQVGVLEERNRTLEERLKTLPPVIEYDRLKMLLSQEKERVACLESQLEQERGLTWWDRLRGKRVKPP